jgi:hypothetical protein
MPKLRRLERLQPREPDPLDVFQWSRDGTYHVLGDKHYRDRAEAARAWQKARRAVWACTSRFRIPGAATAYDGLTMEGLDYVLAHWNVLPPFNGRVVLQRLASDRAHIAHFEATNATGARAIADYLGKLRADLDVIEQTARALVGVPYVARRYPHHIAGSTLCYGDLDA